MTFQKDAIKLCFCENKILFQETKNLFQETKILCQETKILFQETKLCFMKRKFRLLKRKYVSTQLTKNICLSLFSSIIYNYKCITSHHEVIKDDASRKTVRITVGFESHSNFYILQFCYRTKT